MPLFPKLGTSTVFVLLAQVLVQFAPDCECIRDASDDVKAWARAMSEWMKSKAEDVMMTKDLQRIFDRASYSTRNIDADRMVLEKQRLLTSFFGDKERLVMKLKDQIEKSYSSSSISSSSFKDVDEPHTLPHLTYNSTFRRPVNLTSSAIKIAPSTDQATSVFEQAASATLELNPLFMKGQLEDNAIRWQYFGSPHGFVRVYPSLEWPVDFTGLPQEYDPRFRPWYLSATSGRKDVVIIVDCSLSMRHSYTEKNKRIYDYEKWEIAKALVEKLLNTLTKNDNVNVICARSGRRVSGRWISYTNKIISCNTTSLVKASSSHRADILNRLKVFSPEGGSDMRSAFTTAFGELAKSQTNSACQKQILFITDGYDSEPCSKQSSNRRRQQSSVCRASVSALLDEIETLQQTAKEKVTIHSFMTKSRSRWGEEIPGGAACKNGGSFHVVDSSAGSSVAKAVHDYYDVVEAQSRQSTPRVVWTSPYVDSWGLGMVVTASVPCYDNNRLIGVAAIDVSFDELAALLSYSQWGTAYAFLVNEAGETFAHPRLQISNKLVGDLVFPDANLLEQWDGHPSEFSKVLASLRNQQTGSVKIPNSPRLIRRGDKLDGVAAVQDSANYYYGNVSGSLLAFAFNLANDDIAYLHPKELSEADSSSLPTNYYHLLKDYQSLPPSSPAATAANHLSLSVSNNLLPPALLSSNQSVFKLAAKTFCDPQAYLLNRPSSPALEQIHDYFNTNKSSASNGCSTGPFRVDVKAEVQLTALAAQVWDDRTAQSFSDVVWTYLGTGSGVLRVLPGARFPRNYDPTRRSWYHRAVANPGLTTVSYPYLDENGAGRILSISRSLRVSKSAAAKTPCITPAAAACPCTDPSQCLSGLCYNSTYHGIYDGLTNVVDATCGSHRISGVVGFDMRYDALHRSLMAVTQCSTDCATNPSCSQRCYVFDSYGTVVLAPSFFGSEDVTSYQRVPLGKLEGGLVQQLVSSGFFEKNHHLEYLGLCAVSPLRPVVSLSGLVQTPEEQDNYYKNQGPFPAFSNTRSCIQDVVSFELAKDAVSSFSLQVGDACSTAEHHVSRIDGTNLFLLVVRNRNQLQASNFFNFNCHIMNSLYRSGVFRVGGSCDFQKEQTRESTSGQCSPVASAQHNLCTYNKSTRTVSSKIIVFSIIAFLLCVAERSNFL